MIRRLLALFLLISIALVGRSMAQHSNELPSPIVAFYQDRNFVSIFSIAAERSTVAAYARLSEEAQKQERLSRRLGTIAPMMTRIERHVVETDSRINIPGGRRRGTNAGYDEIAELKEFRKFKDGFAVRVTACEVDPRGRASLIAIYERGGGDDRALPPLNERLRVGRGRVCHDQIHYWSLVAGEWVTQTNYTAFPDETSR